MLAGNSARFYNRRGGQFSDGGRMHRATMIAAFALAALCASVVFAADDTKVTLKKLVEKRELKQEKNANEFGGDWDNGIDLTLHIDGAAVKDARKYGAVKVEKATDDA